MENNTHQNLTLHRYLDTNGDGTGTKNAIGDYSSAEEIFYIQPPTGIVYRLSRMLVGIEDALINWGFYGGLAALTEGIVVRVSNDSGVITDLTDAMPIKKNAQWGENCFDADLKAAPGAGNDFFQVRWSFFWSGQILRLDGDKNERLEVVLNDSFVGIVDHTFKVDGEIENTRT